MRRSFLVLGLMAILGISGCASAQLPIIDMHLHARRADYIGPHPPPMCAPFYVMPRSDAAGAADLELEFEGAACDVPVFPSETDDRVMRDTIEIMQRRNIIGMVSGEPDLMETWKAASPDRIIVGLDLRVRPSMSQTHVNVRSADDIRALFEAGKFSVLGEVMAQYEGLTPDDPLLAPYWAVAEELDIPVGIHLGPGGPGEPYSSSGYRARNSSALGMEEVMARHPRLRVYLMHAGYPMADDLRALLFAYPQVYVDISSIVYTEPRPAFYAFLKDLVDAGYGDRILFGSDQMIWPGVIEPSIQSIEDAPFLTQAQKRNIFYNNAARFLRLSDDEIARHHKMGEDK